MLQNKSEITKYFRMRSPHPPQRQGGAKVEFMTPLEAREDAVAASIRDLSEMSERNAAAATRSVEDAEHTSRKSSDRRHRSASLKLESAKYIKCIVRVKKE